MCLCFIVAKGGSKQTENDSGKQTDEWEGYRTVEILGWHQKEKEVLFLIHLRNNKVNNPLKILHPGNVRCKIADLSNGFPLHQDEIERGVKQDDCILKKIYGGLLSFNKEKGTFHREKTITAWDSLREANTKHDIIKIYKGNDDLIKDRFDFAEETKFKPFSTWELESFEDTGEYLIALYITVNKASYAEFVEKGSFFVVDGPKRLLDRIKYWHIPNLAPDKQEKWRNKLSEFEECLPFNESYDVVTLGEPLADRVIADMDGSTLITEGVLGLTSGRPFKRYITADSSFKLRLSYEDGLFKDKREVLFAESQHPRVLSVPPI
jgi:hypothetical protein